MEALIAFGFIILTGFFAGSETAFISINRVKLHSNLESKDRRYHVLAWLLSRPEDMLGSFLIGTNFCIVAGTLVFSGFMFRITEGALLTPLYVTLIMTPVVLLFADVFPKIVFRRFSDEITHFLAFVYGFLFIIFFPIQFLFVRTIKLILSLFGFRKKRRGGGISRDDFKTLLDITTAKGGMKESEKEFIESIMNFKNVKAREIMMPLIRMICAEENDKIEKVVENMLSSKHNRLPVYRSRIDNIIGYVENKDIISARKDETVASYIREALFVPESLEVDKLLVEMQGSASQMVFTADEYGGISGVITTHDLVSEIVGEFGGVDDNLIIKQGDMFIVDGILDIDELEEELSIDIEKFNFETVAGFMMFKLEKIPKVGDSFEFSRFIFEVASMNELRIEKVKIYPKKRRYLNGNGKDKEPENKKS